MKQLGVMILNSVNSLASRRFEFEANVDRCLTAWQV